VSFLESGTLKWGKTGYRSRFYSAGRYVSITEGG
jgi:hypothetical protein